MRDPLLPDVSSENSLQRPESTLMTRQARGRDGAVQARAQELDVLAMSPAERRCRAGTRARRAAPSRPDLFGQHRGRRGEALHRADLRRHRGVDLGRWTRPSPRRARARSGHVRRSGSARGTASSCSPATLRRNCTGRRVAIKGPEPMPGISTRMRSRTQDRLRDGLADGLRAGRTPKRTSSRKPPSVTFFSLNLPAPLARSKSVSSLGSQTWPGSPAPSMRT